MFKNTRKSKAPVSSLPKTMHEHTIFLITTALKLAKRQGFAKPKQYRFKKAPLHLPHLAIMACLEENGSLSQQELSDRLYIDSSDLVSMIDSLEANKYVTRNKVDTDRRRYVLSLTERGDSELPGFSIRENKLQDNFLSTLTGRERKQLNRLLAKLIDSCGGSDDD